MCNFLFSSLEREKHPHPRWGFCSMAWEYWWCPFLATLTLASFMLLGWRMETVNRKKVPAWNISQQALWIFNNTVMTSGKRHCCWLFQMCFFLLSFFWLLLLWAPKDCFFSFLKKNPFLVQVLNLSRRYAGSGGEHRGLMGIKQQGKQASKLKQKPQTWPRVNRKSLVTCQAASGVITPNTMGFITLNYTHYRSNRA